MSDRTMNASKGMKYMDCTDAAAAKPRTVMIDRKAVSFKQMMSWCRARCGAQPSCGSGYAVHAKARETVCARDSAEPVDNVAPRRADLGEYAAW